ncbi:MAG: DUF4258 domain-containing protein [Blastocatellia bacterium]
MLTEAELLERIKALVSAGKYFVGSHATQHMFAEGFSINDIVEAVTGKSRILERYSNASRCLVVGYFQVSDKTRAPLHLVVEYSDEDEIDIVTAYIPQKPWWITPWQRGRSK